MKKYYFLLLLTPISLFAHTQTGSEWFRQKKTKINYLVEQIAALNVYGDYVGKGYSLAKKGLTVISEIKGDDLTLHSDYFASLRHVNPVVKHYSKIFEIITWQVAILKLCQQQKKAVYHPAHLRVEEAKYIDTVLTSLLAGCTDIVEELIRITTNDSTEMKDNERLTRIDALYADMQDRYSFIQSFTAEVGVLIMQRREEGSDIKTTRTLFGVH